MQSLPLLLLAVLSSPVSDVASDNSELTLGRERLWLTTRVEPLVLSLRGPGRLSLSVRVNLPPEGDVKGVSARLKLVRVQGPARTTMTTVAIAKPRDEALGYAETDRYRPSKPASFVVDIPSGEGAYWLEVGDSAPLGVAIGVGYEFLGRAQQPSVEVSEAPGAIADDPLIPTSSRGVVARAGAVRSLVEGGAVGLGVGVGARYPVLDWLHAELSADVYRLLFEGEAPEVAYTGAPTRAEALYQALPLRLGAVARWRAGGVQPYAGLGAGVTWGTERVLGLRGAVDRTSAFSMLSVCGRIGAEWFFHRASGPAVAEVRWLGHPVSLSGDVLGEPPPVSTIALEVGYHLVF